MIFFASLEYDNLNIAFVLFAMIFDLLITSTIYRYVGLYKCIPKIIPLLQSSTQPQLQCHRFNPHQNHRTSYNVSVKTRITTTVPVTMSPLQLSSRSQYQLQYLRYNPHHNHITSYNVSVTTLSTTTVPHYNDIVIITINHITS